MATEVQVPPLGESVLEATVGTWHRQEAERVAAGDALVSLETEKVAVEVTSAISGTLEHILCSEGETVKVGQILATVAEGQPAGPPRETSASNVSSVRVEEISPPDQGDDGEPDRGAELGTHNTPAPSSPGARREAAEKGVALSRIAGGGPGGRIREEDVNRQAEKSPAPPQSAPVPTPSTTQPASTHPPAPPTGSATTSGPPAAATPAAAPASSSPPAALPSAVGVRPDEERVRLSRRRLTIARRLVEAQHTAAMLTTFNEVDMSAVMAIRARRKTSFQDRHGVGLGFMSFFTKAVVGALKAFPPVNSEIDGETLVLKHYYDIGVAVSTPEGLVVPVLRDADRKSFAEIEQEIADLARRARENQLTLPDLMGGTFTITNGGVFGSMLSTPILNPPQVGILGMHRIQQRAMVVNDQIVARPMMYLALSYDHRVVDGREAVQFLVRVKDLVEDPESLLLEG